MDTPPVPPAPPPPPPPPPAPPPPPPPPPPAPAAKGSNKALIIVLCIVGALVLLIGGCVITCTYFVRKGVRKAQQYSDTARKNPQLAAFEFAASMTPNIEVVSKDADAGKITLRNTKTGEVVTLDLSQQSIEKMTQAMQQFSHGVKPAAAAAEPEEEEAEATPAQPARRSTPAEPTVTSARATALAATLQKFPDFIPVYRGGTTVGATMNSFGGSVVGNYSFTTSDPPETAAGFYEKRLTSAGFTIISKQNDSNDNGPTVVLVAQHPTSQTTATCKAEIEDGKTHVEVDFVKAGGG